jgi:hypothetical protein
MINYKYIVVTEIPSTDRIFKLKVKEGFKAINAKTIWADPRLFNGENRLHAIQDTGLWYLKYDCGALPEVLKQRFTNFNQLIKFTTNYFNMRNIEIEEIVL